MDSEVKRGWEGLTRRFSESRIRTELVNADKESVKKSRGRMET